MTEPVWNDWGPPLRVRIEAGPVWVFARAVKDHNPIYASEDAARGAGFSGIPCPPTFTFVMTHSCTFPDLQPPGATGRLMEITTEDLANKPGLYLHGEQEFVYHRQPLVGDVLEGRARVSEPVVREGRRTMQFTWFETVWRDLGGTPVVTERITSIYLPQGAP